MSEFDLHGKTELSINGIYLDNADLNQIADTVADTLKIDRGDLLVTDVRDDNLVLDILKGDLDAREIVGKNDELLRRLSSLPGIRITGEASTSSRGLLSWIALDPAEARKALERAEVMAGEMEKRLKKTAVVFSTGVEVAGGQVMDSNAPAIRKRLNSEGYTVKFAAALKDDDILIAAHLKQAAMDGYGLVVTTGGVGAEDKDRTIEAVLMVDPEAATPEIVKYQLGIGRHKHKDSVRIAVGSIYQTTIVALPGPNDEVLPGLDALACGLAAGYGKRELAENIACALRKRLREKCSRTHGEGEVSL